MHTDKYLPPITTPKRHALGLALVAGLLMAPTILMADELDTLEITIRVIEHNDQNPANELSLPVEILRELENTDHDKDDSELHDSPEHDDLIEDHEDLVDDHLEHEDREEEHHKPEDEREEAIHGEEFEQEEVVESEITKEENDITPTP